MEIDFTQPSGCRQGSEFAEGMTSEQFSGDSESAQNLVQPQADSAECRLRHIGLAKGFIVRRGMVIPLSRRPDSGGQARILLLVPEGAFCLIDDTDHLREAAGGVSQHVDSLRALAGEDDCQRSSPGTMITIDSRRQTPAGVLFLLNRLESGFQTCRSIVGATDDDGDPMIVIRLESGATISRHGVDLDRALQFLDLGECMFELL